MALEIEAKVKVQTHEVIRQRLQAAGAHRMRRVLETNMLFDDESKRLRRSGQGLRVRNVQVLEGEPLSATMTFKGPIQQADLKVRTEHEITIDPANGACAILEKLGLVPFLTFEKNRETWKLGNCTVELDEVPKIGLFVEIEGPDAAAVRGTVARLELSDQPLITHSYVHMLLSFCKAAGIDTTAICFDHAR